MSQREGIVDVVFSAPAGPSGCELVELEIDGRSVGSDVASWVAPADASASDLWRLRLRGTIVSPEDAALLNIVLNCERDRDAVLFGDASRKRFRALRERLIAAARRVGP
jgi:hypothetical protein